MMISRMMQCSGTPPLWTMQHVLTHLLDVGVCKFDDRQAKKGICASVVHGCDALKGSLQEGSSKRNKVKRRNAKKKKRIGRRGGDRRRY